MVAMILIMAVDILALHCHTCCSIMTHSCNPSLTIHPLTTLPTNKHPISPAQGVANSNISVASIPIWSPLSITSAHRFSDEQSGISYDKKEIEIKPPQTILLRIRLWLGRLCQGTKGQCPCRCRWRQRMDRKRTSDDLLFGDGRGS